MTPRNPGGPEMSTPRSTAGAVRSHAASADHRGQPRRQGGKDHLMTPLSVKKPRSDGEISRADDRVLVDEGAQPSRRRRAVSSLHRVRSRHSQQATVHMATRAARKSPSLRPTAHEWRHSARSDRGRRASKRSKPATTARRRSRSPASKRRAGHGEPRASVPVRGRHEPEVADSPP